MPGRALSVVLLLATLAARDKASAPVAAAARAGGPDTAARRAAYDRWRRPEALVAALRLAPGARVADVGAGDGYLTRHLVAAGARVVATDVDRAALLDLARACPSAEIRAVAADDPGLERGAYDLVLLAQVDSYLRDRTAYFRRVAAALAPGGRLAVSNRLPFRDAVRAAAAGAGLVELPAADVALPGQFLLLFQVPP